MTNGTGHLNTDAAAAAATAAAVKDDDDSRSQGAVMSCGSQRPHRRRTCAPVSPVRATPSPAVSQLMEMGFARGKAEAAVKQLGV